VGDRLTLWHPDSPGQRVLIRPCLLRHIGVIRSEFAALSEVLRMYKEATDRTKRLTEGPS